ncbi:hypothetical protein P167DRAFT_493506 [Morchella conica CCBAS932]|uniref:GTP-binding protein n=1 Tax=Morchella conica CCBAS932 TaxID=1392247 RepID=A0A3N4KE73_9PEZI|nr:hypothetical protein P167DRAFT_493506 [Morchella conica CCBAS932]
MTLLCGKDGCECLIKHPRKPRILLMGQRQAGKTSIVECVFRKLPPEETLFVDPTVKMHKVFVTSFLSFIIYDAPGQLNFLELSFDITGIFDNIDTIIWVFDAQTEWVDALIRFHRTLLILKDRFPNMNIEVFIHKVEGMSDEYALEIKEDIIRRTEEELMDNERSGMAIRYHLTSIYDRTLWEALSRVVQRVTPRLNAVEGLLDSLCENTGMVKIFLFDLYSKLYVATDTSPVDMQILDTCTHHIEFVSEMESIFGYVYKRKKYMEEQEDSEYKTPEVCSMVSLNDGKRLYMKEINQYLAIVGVSGKRAMKQISIVDFNISVFQEAVIKLISERWEEPTKPPE